MRFLVTGGTGYIGSHVCVELIAAGHDVVVADDLSNSRAGVLDRIAAIAGRRPAFRRVDVRDLRALADALAPFRFDGAVHMAGLKAVGESVREPWRYYAANVSGTAHVLEASRFCPLVFSSSATVYGAPARCPIREDDPVAPANPYGASKLFAEQVVRDTFAARGGSAMLLRYFNPVGAHESGLIGEDPLGEPNNLMPVIEQVAIGAREKLAVFGRDWPTPDGTGVRDYVHVADLARAHRLALEACIARSGVTTLNLGTGRGHSVLEVVAAFERTAGRAIPTTFAPRRPGDVAQCWADPSRAERELGWRAERGLDAACRDSLRWREHWQRALAPRAGRAAA